MTATFEQSAPPGLDIRGDVGAAGGDVRFTGDVRVGGTIRDGMTVDVEGALVVAGSIEASFVSAARGVSVGGSIVGRGKGKVISGGAVACRTANAAHIESVKDLTAEVELLNSRLIVGGTLRCEGGTIHGGHVTANGGVICSTLGSRSGAATLIEAGFDERLRRLGATQATTVLANLNKIHKVRSQLQPLMAHQRNLTPQQKETATELLYEADELESSTQKTILSLRRLSAALQATSRSEITVTTMLHAGVTVRFEGVEALFDKDMAGPLRLWCKALGNDRLIYLTHLADNSMRCLGSTAFKDELLSDFAQAIAPRPKAQAA